MYKLVGLSESVSIQIRKPDTQDTKIFMAHGTVDQVLQ